MTVEPFGLKVFYETASPYRPERYPASRNVTLPHQCDDWMITGLGEAWDDDPSPSSREEAILDLCLFIDEAKEALTWLIGQPAEPDGRVEWTAEKEADVEV